MAFIACTESLAPRWITIRLQDLYVSDLGTTVDHGGMLEIRARAVDKTLLLEERQRVPIEIAVSSGDRESVGMYHLLCPPRERWWIRHDCFRFTLWMHEGAHAADLGDYVAAIGGRFHLISVSGRLAGVTVFSPHDLVRRARRARSWPGVAYTELTGSFCAPDNPGCLSGSDLKVPVPVDVGPPVPGDGIVQVRSGDTVVVTYQQPDGGVLQASVTAP